MRHSSRAAAYCVGRRAKGWLAVTAVLLFLAAAFAACGDGDSTPEATETTAATAKKVTASQACTDSFRHGHNQEKGGEPTPKAFLPSIQACQSLEEWTAAERAFGVNLQGQEARFVDNTCFAASPEVQALRICKEAKAQVKPSG